MNAVKRNNKEIKLKNGSAGYILHKIMLLRKYSYNVLYPLRMLSAAIEERGLLRIFHPLIKLEKMNVTNKSKKEILLIYKGRVIGRKNVKNNKWKIKFPYKLIIDKRKI